MGRTATVGVLIRAGVLKDAEDDVSSFPVMYMNLPTSLVYISTVRGTIVPIHPADKIRHQSRSSSWLRGI